jgi:hypothetical protein
MANPALVYSCPSKIPSTILNFDNNCNSFVQRIHGLIIANSLNEISRLLRIPNRGKEGFFFLVLKELGFNSINN